MSAFDKLKSVRGKLAAIPAHAVDAATRKEIVAALEDLDDAMVTDLRAERYARTLPTPYDITTEYLAMFAGSATTGEPCA